MWNHFLGRVSVWVEEDLDVLYHFRFSFVVSAERFLH
jgi:hypothetical protein